MTTEHDDEPFQAPGAGPRSAKSSFGAAALDGLGRAWNRVRQWRWYWQVLVFALLPLAAWMYAGSRPAAKRRPWVVVAVIVTVGYSIAVVVSNVNEDRAEREADRAAATSTTAAEEASPSSEPRPTSTEMPTTAVPTTAEPPSTTVPEAERDGDDPNPGTLYPDRPDIQDADYEQQVGGSPVRFTGFSVWALETEYVERVDDFTCCGYLRVRVRILNRDDEQQNWNRLDFSLVRPSGEVYSPSVVVQTDDTLGLSGGLVHGGQVEGDVWFSVEPDELGDYYLYWEPAFEFDDDRGVWRTTR